MRATPAEPDRCFVCVLRIGDGRVAIDADVRMGIDDSGHDDFAGSVLNFGSGWNLNLAFFADSDNFAALDHQNPFHNGRCGDGQNPGALHHQDTFIMSALGWSQRDERG